MDSKISKLLNIKRYLNKTLFKTPGVEYLRKNHSFVDKKKRYISFWLDKACKNEGFKKFFFEKSNENLSENLSNYKFNTNNKFIITNEMFDVLSNSGLLIIEDALPVEEKNKVIDLFSELKNKNYSNQWKKKPTNILRNQTDLNNNDELSLLQKMIKQRNDSIKQYYDAGRNELAEKEQKEIEIIQNFLPEQISEEELFKLAKETIHNLSANSMKDMGSVMKALKDKTFGQADPAAISKIVKELLS